MNALDLLRSDHDRIDELIDRFESAVERTEKRHIFERLRTELDAHAHVEETVFYPYFEKKEAFREIVTDSYDDHLEMRELIEDLDSAFEESTDEELEDVFDELVGSIQGHVDDEETEFFSTVEELCTSEELIRLGTQIDLARDSFLPSRAA